MSTLFDWRDQYPYAPGFKERGGTSQEAAETIKPRLGELHERVLRALSRRPMTTDEAAAFLGETVLAIRPRFSELKENGLIAKTTERRKNQSGQSAIVWRRV